MITRVTSQKLAPLKSARGRNDAENLRLAPNQRILTVHEGISSLSGEFALWTASKIRKFLQQKVLGKARRTEVAYDRRPERKDDPVRHDCDDSLGKAIKEEQRTDKVGASAMWQSHFASCFSKGYKRKKAETRKCV